MLRQILAVGALLIPIPALAQSNDYLPCSDVQDAGTYVLATGELLPPGSVGGTDVNPQVIYNNTCPTGFFHSVLSGSVIIDEGRLPSSTSPAPNAGIRQSYFVTQFQISYCTRELDTSLAGPGATVQVRFFEDYDDCVDLVTAGVPQADYTLTGLPASAAVGTLSCWTVTIDLTGGFEFCLKADSEGTFSNSAILDGFGYALNMPGQTGTTTATSGGFILAGDVTAPGDCAKGDGTYYKNPGAAAGTGLDNDDLFRREGSGTQTTGCFFFGGPPNPHSGFYLTITADLDDCSCLPNDTDGDGVTDCLDQCPGSPDVDTDGDGLLDCLDNCPSVANPGQEDCNGDGIGDACNIASSYSLDTNGDSIPDECQQGTGTPYCFGDGTGTPCPCANSGGAGSGCLNSTGNGALCYSFGGASVSAHDTAFYSVRLPKNTMGLYFMGDTQLGGGLGIPLFDGLACAGGNIRRFPVQFSGTTGVNALFDPATTYSALVVPGSTWNFTNWYRDAVGSPCGTNANLSNAVQLSFLP